MTLIIHKSLPIKMAHPTLREIYISLLILKSILRAGVGIWHNSILQPDSGMTSQLKGVLRGDKIRQGWGQGWWVLLILGLACIIKPIHHALWLNYVLWEWSNAVI